MSEMQQRTVAEILGWSRCAAAEGSERFDGPTPDDMIDWLVLRGLEFEADAHRYKRKTQIYWAVASAKHATEHDGLAPSLHAALEAAVRAVSSASPQTRR